MGGWDRFRLSVGKGDIDFALQHADPNTASGRLAENGARANSHIRAIDLHRNFLTAWTLDKDTTCRQITTGALTSHTAVKIESVNTGAGLAGFGIVLGHCTRLQLLAFKLLVKTPPVCPPNSP